MAFRCLTAISAVVLMMLLSMAMVPAPALMTPPGLVAFAQPLDTDGDGIPDAIDTDDDNDFVDDWADYAPLDPNVQYAPAPDLPVQNPVQVAPEIVDSDVDGIPDSSDFDNDNDGVIDSEDYEPSNPIVQNPPVIPGDNIPPPATDTGNDYEQDTDRDGIPNHLDPDDDNDAVQDRDELAPTAVPTPVLGAPTPPSAPAPPPSGNGDQKPVDGPISKNTSTSSGAPVVSALPKTGSGSESSLPVLTIVVVAGLGILGVNVRSKNPSER